MEVYTDEDDSHLTSQADVKSLSSFQSYIHEVDRQDTNPPPVVSYYDYQERVVVYSSPSDHKMKCTEIHPDSSNSSRKFAYEPYPKMDKLLHVYAICKLPSIKVEAPFRDRIEIALCPNFMHNLISSAVLMINCGLNSEFKHTINTFTYDAYRAKDCDSLDIYDYSIGNRRELIQWGSELKTGESLVLPLPFFMDSTYRYALPLHMYDKRGTVQIVCTMDLSLKNYIRMRAKRKSGEWMDIPRSEIDLSFLRVDGPLSPPQVWGRYTTLTDQARGAELVSVSEGTDRSREAGYSIIFTDYEHFRDREVTTRMETSLPRQNAAVRGIRYAFLNYKASLFNNYSNYSMDFQTPRHSCTPASYHSLSCGGLMRIPKRESVHSSLIPALYSSRAGSSDKRLFHEIVWDHYPYNPGPDTSILPKENKFVVALKSSATSAKRQSEEGDGREEDPVIPLSEIVPAKRVGTLISRTLHRYKDTGLLDDSPSFQYIFKGYCRVLKKITFSPENILVETE